MKFLLLTLLFGPLITFAQRDLAENWINPPIKGENQSGQQSFLDCTPVKLTGCNYLLNNTFQSSTMPPANLEPFNYGLMPHWTNEVGSPNVYDGINFDAINYPPPFPNSGYAWLGAETFFNGLHSEGLSQHIPSTIQGHKYVLSFYRRCVNVTEIYNPGLYPHFDIDNFDIYLTDCDFHNSYYNFNHTLPTFPLHRQRIHCETFVPFDGPWKRVFATFVADDSYDLFWAIIYGGQYTEIPQASGMAFAYPELIDVTNFSAGPSPTPTFGNCMVTIGPTVPNCSVYGAVFKWYGPQGQIISANANQQLTVNASTSAGVWTLKMEVPNALILNNSCNNAANVQAYVTVPSCSGTWPKAYSTLDGYSKLLKDNSGNIFLGLYSIWNSISYNHSGTSIPSGTILSPTIQFTNTGYSNWLMSSATPVFCTSSGLVEIADGLNNSIDKFYNVSTGVVVSSPITLQPSEHIIAETSTGAYITLVNNNLNVHSGSGITTVATGGYGKTKFNPITNKLYFYGGTFTRVFTFSGNTLIPSAIMTPAFPSFTHFVQIDNGGRGYFLSNGKLKQYNFSNNTVANINILGFSNNDLNEAQSDNPYTGDIGVVFNQLDLRIYTLNFITMKSKKIQASTNFWGALSYEIAGDNLYLASNYYSDLQIGTQTIPIISAAVPVWITKLSLQNDFSNFSNNPIVAEYRTTGVNPTEENGIHTGKSSIFSKQPLFSENIKFIEIIGALGQRYQTIYNKSEIINIVSDRTGSLTIPKGIWFLKISYKDNTIKTFKRIQL